MNSKLRTRVVVQSRPIKVRIFFIKMRVAQSLPSFDIEKSFLNKKVLFFYKNNFLVSKKPSDFPF